MKHDTKRQERLKNANEFIKCISSCGRNFFAYKDDLCFFELDQRGRVWFTDAYSKKKIYTHYEGRWKGFTHGGTLKSFVSAIKDYIVFDHKLNYYYFNDKSPELSHPWGYQEDMKKVLDCGIKIGIIDKKPTG